jgi:hypothetical protein
MHVQDLWIAFSAFAVLGCASPSAPPAEGPPAGGEEAAASDVESGSDVAGEAASSESAEDATGEAGAAPPPPPQESLFELCNKMCDDVAPKCTPMQLKGCKSTCESYEAHPDACDGVVRTALECARADKDFLFCANVVPDSCAKEYKNIQVCADTGKPPADAVAKGPPEGWERFKGGGFSVVVPKGMKAKNEGGVKKWVVSQGDASYEVSVHEAPKDAKLTNRSFLKVMGELFPKCAPKMKLHALVEREQDTSIQYHGVCPDGKGRKGRLHVVGGEMYVLLVEFQSGNEPEVDAFVYSFEK